MKSPESFEDFSRKLITSGDLDPDYILLNNWKRLFNLDQEFMIKWAIIKIFIYDTASEYNYLFNLLPLDKLKYGAERRKNKHRTAEQLTTMIYKFKIADLPLEYNEALKYLLEFDGVGSWAAWKFCDLLERVCDVPMDFSKVDFRKAYSFPLKGLCRVNGESDDYVKQLNDDLSYQIFMHVTERKLMHSGVLELKAPPNFNRTINIQEIETCLCKYHSYLNGHYAIGQDTEHLLSRLNEERIAYPDIYGEQRIGIVKSENSLFG